MAELTNLVNIRRPIRRAVSVLQTTVEQWWPEGSDPPDWSREVEKTTAGWLATIERLNQQLNTQNERIMDIMAPTTDEDGLDTEYQRCQQYAAMLDALKYKIVSYRTMYAPRVAAAQPESPRSSQVQLTEAIASLVELQRVALTNAAGAAAPNGGSAAPNRGDEANQQGDINAILNRLVTAQEASTGGAGLLPTIKMKRFKGDSQEFLPFIDEFRKLVHERPGFDDMQKHKILRDLLDGDAAKALAGIQLTEANYPLALHYLIQRFGCVQTIIFGVFSRMFDLPKVSKVGDGRMLRDMLDHVNTSIITLKALKFNEDSYTATLYSLVMRAIPDSLSLEFIASVENQQAIDTTQPPNLEICARNDLPQEFTARFQALLDFVTLKVTTREKQRAMCPRDNNACPKPLQSKTTTGHLNVYKTSAADNGKEPHPSKSESPICLFCRGKHVSAACQADMSPDDKIKCLREAGACLKCARMGHWTKSCTKKLYCKSCKGRHMRVLCPQAGDSAIQTVAAGRQLLPTGHVDIVCDKDNQPHVTRFLLDSGSQLTFITAKLADALAAKVIDSDFTYLHVFGGKRPQQAQRLPVVRIKMQATNGDIIEIAARVVDSITSNLLPAPTKQIRSRLHGVQLAERANGPATVDLLLGAAAAFSVIEGPPCHVSSGIILLNTRFGGVVVTETDTRGGQQLVTSITAPSLDRFWSLESIGIHPEELDAPVDYRILVKKFNDGVERGSDGKYQVKLNLRSNIKLLESNSAMAVKQLRSLAKRLNKDPTLKQDYIKEVRAFIDNGFAEPLPQNEQPEFTMPHFPVVQPTKTSYKVRPVFNASASARGKLSLNDCIEDMPNLLPCPLAALTNFRRYNVAWAADIGRAYLMVKVHPDHRNLLCFVWYKNETELTGHLWYRMTATSFGVKDSQHNTIAVIRRHAETYETSYPDASSKLMSDVYMDDVLTGADTTEKAAELWNDIQKILSEAGMMLKKFKTNSPQLRTLAETTEVGTDILLRPPAIDKVLGVGWDQDKDVLMFDPHPMIDFAEKATPTMRTLMGACARLYDPQGLIAPFTMNLKLILQTAHLNKLSLDQTLPPELLKQWMAWCDNLTHLTDFSVPRRLHPPNATHMELHAFCDASDRAYAAVIYIKTTSTINGKQQATVRLVASKAKLAPLKQLDSLTIPKKELLGALLATRLVHKVAEHLRLVGCPIYLWSDAQVALQWIWSGNPAKWGVFVRNRLLEILQSTSPEQWRHCPGEVNPADLPSRGLHMKALGNNKLWLNGPPFLSGPPAKYPKTERQLSAGDLPETRTLTVSAEPPLIDPTKFSTLSKLVRIFAYVRRAMLRFRELHSRTSRPTLGPLTARELSDSKQHLIQQAQNRCLGETKEALAAGKAPEDSVLAAFKPFIDDSGSVRVGGRLQCADEPYDIRHPVLLRDDPFTQLLILDAHQFGVGHMKVDAVMNYLREKYWIVRMRQLVKTVIYKCSGCLRENAKRATAEEAPLPAKRVEMSFRPFKTVGIDYMGPISIRTEAGEKKVWVALFTCAVVRAVHLEVVEDMSAGACLSALKRFAALRGVPATLVSDNALTFKKADRCLQVLWKGLRSEGVQNYLGQGGVSWEFNIPRAPWWGGFWERMVAVVKGCLRKTMKAQKITYTNLVTVLNEIAAIVNQRPLTRQPDGPDELRALTPAHFLTSAVPLTFPAGQLVSLGDRPDGLVKAWKQRERMLNGFWRRWREEYLLVLRSALRRRGEGTQPLCSGDIVLLEKEGVARAFWQLGRVEEAITGRDGVPRAYKVHLGGGQYVSRAGKLLVKML